MISATTRMAASVLLGFLLSAAPAGAQNAPPSEDAQQVASTDPFSGFGIKAGLNVSNLSIDDPADPDLEFDSQTGLMVGAFFQCGIGSKFALQAEALYSQEGAKAQGVEPAFALDLDYIRVPVLLVGRLPFAQSRIGPFLYAGPQVAFEARCQVNTELDGMPANLDCDSPELEDPLETKNIEFGLVFGGGLQFSFSRLTALLDARYQLGLTNLNSGTNASEVSLKNRVWSFTVGLGMALH